MLAPSPPPDTHPDAALLALERDLEEALILADTLARAWDEATTDQGRRLIERQADVTLERIARLQQEIAATPARTLAGGAVQLRRLQAMMGYLQPHPRAPLDDMEIPRHLLVSARCSQLCFKPPAQADLGGASKALSRSPPCKRNPQLRAALYELLHHLPIRDMMPSRIRIDSPIFIMSPSRWAFSCKAFPIPS